MAKKMKRISDLTDKMCNICGSCSYGDLIAICYKCNVSEHLYCMKHQLLSIPSDKWCCHTCSARSEVKQPFTKNTIKPVVVSKVKFLPLQDVTMQTFRKKRKPSGSNVPRGTTAVKHVFPACPVSPKTLAHSLSDENFVNDGLSVLPSSSPLSIGDLTKGGPTFSVPQPTSPVSARASSKAAPKSPVPQPEVPVLHVARTDEISPASKSLDSRYHSKQPVTVLIPHMTLSDFRTSEIQWRGKFEILNVAAVDAYDGILAFYASHMNQKAYEAAKSLPVTLNLKVMRRLDVWPKIFYLDPPDRDDIALSFVSEEDERSKLKYSRLLERMNSQDLGMRCSMGKVELLVFSSKLLPCFEQLNGYPFLWGIFRSLKQKHLDPLPVQDIPNARFDSPLSRSPEICPSEQTAERLKPCSSPRRSSLETLAEKLSSDINRAQLHDPLTGSKMPSTNQEIVCEPCILSSGNPVGNILLKDLVNEAYPKDGGSDCNMLPTGKGAACNSDLAKRPLISFPLKKPLVQERPPTYAELSTDRLLPPSFEPSIRETAPAHAKLTVHGLPAVEDCSNLVFEKVVLASLDGHILQQEQNIRTEKMLLVSRHEISVPVAKDTCSINNCNHDKMPTVFTPCEDRRPAGCSYEQKGSWGDGLASSHSQRGPNYRNPNDKQMTEQSTDWSKDFEQKKSFVDDNVPKYMGPPSAKFLDDKMPCKTLEPKSTSGKADRAGVSSPWPSEGSSSKQIIDNQGWIPSDRCKNSVQRENIGNEAEQSRGTLSPSDCNDLEHRRMSNKNCVPEYVREPRSRWSSVDNSCKQITDNQGWGSWDNYKSSGQRKVMVNDAKQSSPGGHWTWGRNDSEQMETSGKSHAPQSQTTHTFSSWRRRDCKDSDRNKNMGNCYSPRVNRGSSTNWPVDGSKQRKSTSKRINNWDDCRNSGQRETAGNNAVKLEREESTTTTTTSWPSCPPGFENSRPSFTKRKSRWDEER